MRRMCPSSCLCVCTCTHCNMYVCMFACMHVSKIENIDAQDARRSDTCYHDPNTLGIAAHVIYQIYVIYEIYVISHFSSVYPSLHNYEDRNRWIDRDERRALCGGCSTHTPLLTLPTPHYSLSSTRRHDTTHTSLCQLLTHPFCSIPSTHTRSTSPPRGTDHVLRGSKSK